MTDYPHRVDGGPDRRFKVYQKDRVIGVPREGGYGMGPLALAVAPIALSYALSYAAAGAVWAAPHVARGVKAAAPPAARAVRSGARKARRKRRRRDGDCYKLVYSETAEIGGRVYGRVERTDSGVFVSGNGVTVDPASVFGWWADSAHDGYWVLID